MATLAHSTSFLSVGNLSLDRHKQLKLWKFQNPLPRTGIRRLSICRSNLTPWEPAEVAYAPTSDAEGKFLQKTGNIFEALNSNQTDEATSENSKEETNSSHQPMLQLDYLRWSVWLLGPTILLATGIVPTLWLPVSSVFLGPNIASLLSLTGLDCIFNLGAFLFLLLADSCARPKNPNHAFGSRPPVSYQFWNMVANVMGFAVPLLMLFTSQKGFLLPFLPSISFLVLLGPYLLLLSVQMLTEMLIWHWQSPVWLMTPVVYEAYRLLQLMRGLKLGAELTAPAWMLHTIRGLVCWWVLVLGMQLMRVAWYAGVTARKSQQEPSVLVDGN
ncbi:hypothetical protein ACH5RR_023844 [Cinchona calisaya]|uniref:Cytochrome P450 n=1 Tax=Cinchona calisaya TaxID=153742 RepID=A0ABD2ZBS6_9GENT